MFASRTGSRVLDASDGRVLEVGRVGTKEDHPHGLNNT